MANLKEVKKFVPYILNLILIWLTFYFYEIIPYYKNFLRQDTITVIFYLALSYTILGFFYYTFTSKEKIRETKGLLVFRTIKKFLKFKFKEIENREKTALLFTLVKIFFLPIMLNFFFDNYYFIKFQFSQINNIASFFSMNTFNALSFPLILGIIFLIDTLWFSFGYAFESGFLKNKIISVEPTFLGWAVTLLCYPPFNGFLTNQIGWYANDYIFFSSETLTFILKILMVFLLIIYVGATLALGTKCSNLTNRGIVSKGPYKVIRHPAYISKNLAWWVTIIPVATIPAILSMAAWSFIYHLRSITEERHLSKDKNYLEYCKKVKYRYIPGVY